MDQFDFISQSYNKNPHEESSLLLEIDQRNFEAIHQLIKFLNYNDGVVADSTLDLILVIHSVLNECGMNFSFDDTDSVVSLASEFCIINYIKDGQSLEGIELADNSPMLCLIADDYDSIIDSAIILSQRKSSFYSDKVTLAAMSLYGHWEEGALCLTRSVIKSGRLHAPVDTMRSSMESLGFLFESDLQYVDFINKLSDTHLIKKSVSKSGVGKITLNPSSAGMFLVLGGHSQEAHRLSDIVG